MRCRRVRFPGRWFLCLVSCAFALALPVLAGAQQAPPSLPVAPSATVGSVAGTVVDADGALVEGAHVRLVSDSTRTAFESDTDDRGHFRFPAVPLGTFLLTTTADEFAPVQTRGRMTPGAIVELSPIMLGTATTKIEIDALTQHQVAEVEVKQEEHQRLLGVLPNFGVSYDWQAPPLDTKQKFELATRFVIDPINVGIAAAEAGVDYAANVFPAYGTGAAHYWKLFGAINADTALGNYFGGAIYPTLFHQDPRYFWKGTGSVKSRIWYAVTRAVICRGDNGHSQFSISGIAGDLTASAISNVYYPAENRHGVALTFQNGGIAIGADALGNVVQEFVFKWFTPNSRKRKPNVPDAETDLP